MLDVMPSVNKRGRAGERTGRLGKAQRGPPKRGQRKNANTGTNNDNDENCRY